MSEELSLYAQGILGPGRILSLNLLFAYAFSLSFSILLFIYCRMLHKPPFTQRNLFLICIVPTILVTSLLLRGSTLRDFDVSEVIFFAIILTPAVWILPLMAAGYGIVAIRNNQENHLFGYVAVLILEGMAFLFYLLPFARPS